MKQGILGVFVIGFIIFIAITTNMSTEQVPLSVAELAQHLTDSGAKLYTSLWCGHCAAQKGIFGESLKYINYVECSTSDGHQTEVCQDAGIMVYPTWVFGDGKLEPGMMSLKQLAERSGFYED